MQTNPTLAVVTGAARNIGAAVTASLIADGSTVVAIDRDSDALNLMCDQLGPRAIPRIVDLALCDPVQLARDLTNTYGSITNFVANAGVGTASRFLDLTPADFDHVMAVNLRSHLFLAQGFARNLIEERMAGSFVFISSVHQDVPRGFPHYSASKAAIAMVVREAAADLGRHGIRVNAIAPGYTTDNEAWSDPNAISATPIGRPVHPDEIAQVVAYLLSTKAGAVTGANWTIDGGLSTHSWIDEKI